MESGLHTHWAAELQALNGSIAEKLAFLEGVCVFYLRIRALLSNPRLSASQHAYPRFFPPLGSSAVLICPADEAVVAAVAALIDTALVELTTGPDGALRRLNESVDAALLVRSHHHHPRHSAISLLPPVSLLT